MLMRRDNLPVTGRKWSRIGASVALLAALSTGAIVGLSPSGVYGADEPADRYNRLLGRGINLGAALEAPGVGAWGITLKADYFQAIQAAGFQSVRIPIRWSAHTLPQPPYAISPQFFARVDWAIQQALSRKLNVTINVHHFVDVYKDPAREGPRLVALWEQIAEHYRGFPDQLSFELLNEPMDQLTDERWQEMIPTLLQAVRKTNPNRVVIIGPGFWNSLDHLDKLQLPEQDRRLIATIHYYQPFRFTHQEAPWVKDSQQWKGTTWGTPEEQAALRGDLEKAAAWARQNRRPIYLGEFGTYQAAEMQSRARWTEAVAREAEKQGFSWAYWEFGSNMGAFDLTTGSWRAPLLQALIPR
jgi:endoglucanase